MVRLSRICSLVPDWVRPDAIESALCGGLAWLIISPAAVLVARLGRHLHGTWVQLHQLLQIILTLTLTVAAVVVAAVAVVDQGGQHFSDTHMVLGLVLLILLIVQLNLGWIIHHLFDPNRTKRPVRNIAHMGLGILLLLLGFVVAGSGMGNYTRTTPTYVIAIFIVLIAFFAIFYFGSLSLLVHDRHKKGGRPWREAVFGLGRSDEKRGHLISGDWGPGREDQDDDSIDQAGDQQAQMSESWSAEKANPTATLEMQPPSLQGGSSSLLSVPTSGRPVSGSTIERDELRTGLGYQLARNEFQQQRLNHVSLGR
jgi:Eukaryotic cytochrome b561